MSEVDVPYLDILLKFDDGFISTDLYTKPTDAHAYLHNKSCHPKHCITNIPYSQMLRLRRVCSKENDFKSRLAEMSEHFRARGYSEACVSKAAERASSKTRAAALEYTPKVRNSRVPFVITHNPRNPPLRNFLNNQQPILHQNPTLQAAIPEVPVVGERNCRSLKNILMPSILPHISHSLSAGSHSCGKCIVCTTHLVEAASFKSDQTGETVTIRSSLTCESKNIIYLLYCSKCTKMQYIGETQQTLKQRFVQHRSDIGTKKYDKCIHIVTHFNSDAHTKEDMRVIPFDQMLVNDRSARKEKEKFWYTKLKTVHPLGLNEVN